MSKSFAAMQTERERSQVSGSAIVNALPGGALVLDRAGIVRHANAAAARLLGIDRDALLGRRLGELPGGIPALAARAASGVFELEDHALTFELRPLLAEEGGERVGTIVLLEDRENELATRRRQYEYISRALHDVRVPLQAIGGAAEGLLRGWFGPLSDDQREFVMLIKENAGRQGELFNSLFDAYTLSAGLVPLQPERVRVEGILHEAVHELVPRLAARSIECTLEVRENLPLVEADRRRLRQVVMALLENACKYTLPGGAVTVRASAEHGELRVDVADTGVGIRAADQPKIFEPFFRGESQIKEGRYGGLSLAIAKLLTELHGGRIWFESVQDRGSTFSFTLPLSSQ